MAVTACSSRHSFSVEYSCHAQCNDQRKILYKMHVIPLVPETLLGVGESKAIAFSLLPIKFKFYVALGVNVMEHGFLVVIQPSNSPDNIRWSFRGILLISRISCRHTGISNASRVLINLRLPAQTCWDQWRCASLKYASHIWIKSKYFWQWCFAVCHFGHCPSSWIF